MRINEGFFNQQIKHNPQILGTYKQYKQAFEDFLVKKKYRDAWDKEDWRGICNLLFLDCAILYKSFVKYCETNNIGVPDSIIFETIYDEWAKNEVDAINSNGCQSNILDTYFYNTYYNTYTDDDIINVWPENGCLVLRLHVHDTGRNFDFVFTMQQVAEQLVYGYLTQDLHRFEGKINFEKP